MRRYTGKRYKKIFAGILAAALVVNSVPAAAYAQDDTRLMEQNTVQVISDDAADTAAFTETGNETSVETVSEEATDVTTEDTTESTETTEDTENAPGDAENTEDSMADDPESGDEDIYAPDAESGDDVAGDDIALYAASDEDGTLTLTDLAGIEGITINGNSIDVTNADALILVSNCKSEELYDKNISINMSGQIDITGEATLGGNTYTYHSIGTSENPFQGSLSGRLKVILNHTLFGTLNSRATISIDELQWAGTNISGETVFADTFIYGESGDYDFPLKNISMGENAVVGSLMGTIKAADGVTAGTMNIENVIDYNNGTTVTVTGSENAGLICNTLAAGKISLNDFTFPTAYTVTAGTGNAGGIIGDMAEHTGLTINSGSTQEITSLKVTASAGMAGGLVGHMPEGTSLTFSGNGGITLAGTTTNNGDSISIVGQTRAGGIAGEAKDITLEHDGNATFTITTATIETTALQNTGTGGLFGIYETSTDQEFGDWLHVGVIGSDIEDGKRVMVKPTAARDKNAAGNAETHAGGLFGALHIKDNSTVTVIGTSLNVKKSRANFNTSYGAIAGVVDSNNGLNNALVVSGVSDTEQFKIQSWYEYLHSLKTDAYYHGGLVGKLGNGDENSAVYMEAGNIDITVIYPFAGEISIGFGGIVGDLNSYSILRLKDSIKVTTTLRLEYYNDQKIWQGGGIIGKAEAGSVAEFAGTTNVENCHFSASDNDKPGQLVGTQDNALVYARGDGNGDGWKYIRAKSIDIGNDLDTIGNYGQIIRLKSDEATDTAKGLPSDFITINEETHEVSLKTNDSLYDGDTVTISNTEDFARLAIAWQTKGYFSACKNITTANWGDLASASISLTGDVDLTGTGITGLTRDNGDQDSGSEKNKIISDGYIYRGTLKGNGHTVTLAVGESYGYNGTSPATTPGKNTGSIIRHRYQGIFAALGTNAEITGITVGGSIYTAAQDYDMYIGGIAGRLQGTGAITIDSTTTAVDINCLTDTANNRNIYAGGLFGDVTEARTINLGSTAGSESSADSGSAGDSESTADSGSAENANSDIVSGRVVTKARLNIPSNKNVYAGGVIGFIPGDKKITVNCNAVTIAGTIEDNAGTNGTLKAGGLIGWAAYGSAEKSININDIRIDGEKVTADKATKGAGFLGHKWANTTVNFNTPEDASSYALTIDGETNMSQPAAEAGGLVYRASGKWTVNDRGINIKKASYNAKYLGLLVCRGDADRGESTISNQQALYLSLTANWNTAYVIDADASNVSVSGTLAVFDEFVAYTTYGSGSNPSDAISDNGVNGIISLATEDNEGVATTGICNTYKNQTAYGSNAGKTNGCSRYYYNLDAIMQDKSTEVGTSGVINTPERLLIWSVWYYAADNLKTYFDKGFKGVSVIGGTSDASKSSFDMKGLSYYSVKLTGYMTVKNAIFKFDNETIEALETVAKNKSTNGTTASHTQHYMMHCGLFYDMTGRDGTETVSNVSFAGTVGRVNGSSGALCCGTMQGSNTAGTVKYYQVSIDKVVLDGLRVTGSSSVADTEAAPALVNKIGSYSTVTISDISTSGYDDHSNPAGTSLIGYAGDKTATQISVTFSKMTIPDKKYDGTENGGIFTRASFLEAFQYMENGAASIIYNFERKEDWEDTDHIHRVTYGQEISGSKQYTDLQNWYYDKATYGDNTGLVIDDLTTKNNDFSSYLPYVATGYNASGRYFEIMVNQRMSDLLTGCGTYGHPYVLTDALGMNTVAEYIATMTAKNNWKIQVTADQSDYHNNATDTDVVYEYDGTEWKQVKRQSEGSDNWVPVSDGKTMSNETMHRYILSAYYDLQPSKNETSSTISTMELKDFAGFGTENYPFRGVITSTQSGVIVELTGDNTPRGLIPYSYGSVVSNLTIEYSGEGKTITYNDTDVPANDDSTDVTYQPKSFWGGVIGCVMGGDNIIDNVEVTMADDFSLTLDGNRNYLIQTGGYVGSVSGGGVIFRNMSGKTGLTDAHIKKGSAIGAQEISIEGSLTDASGKTNENIKSLYVNPYVGRILDGYAFSEGCEINNGTKSCPVIQLKASDKKISTESKNTVGNKTGYVTTISDAQSLLVFAAIVNSGAASGAGSSGAESTTSDTYKGVLSYRGNTETENGTDYSFGNGQYGKVRNASYKYIGKTKEDGAEDFSLSVADDTKAPGSDIGDGKNVPYLVSSYADVNTFYAAARSGASENVKLTIKLEADTTYDMTEYGNGYPGISARYLSSAVNTGKDATAEWGASYLRPEVNGFIGNNSTIKTSIHLIEYADDDFHAVSLGGVFNLIRVADMNCRSEDTNYLVSDLNITDSTVTLEYCSGDGTEASKAAADFTYVKGRYCVNVGGFAGNTSQNGIRSDNKADAKVATGYVFSNITITGSTITGPNCAGGLMGSTGMGDNSITAGSGLMFYNYKIVSTGDQPWNSAGVNLVNCTYSGITVTAGYVAGGFVGNIARSKSKWDTTSSDYGSSYSVSSLSVTDNKKTAVGSNSTITASQDNMAGGAGGVFGCVSTGLFINDPEFEITDIYSNKASGNNEDSGNNESNEDSGLYTAKFSGVMVTSHSGDAGGVVGRSGANECVIRDVSVTAGDQTKKLVTATRDADKTLHAGGVIGCIRTANKNVLIEKCNASYLTVTGNKPGAGGILGGFEECAGSDIKVVDCHVDNVTVKAAFRDCAVGGLIGHVQGNGNKVEVTVDDCSVNNSSVGDTDTVEWNGGLVGSLPGKANQYLYIYDSSVRNTDVNVGATGGGQAGGLLCSANGTVYCSNILLDGITLSKGQTACLVYSAGQSKTLRVDGVSIKNVKGTNTDKILGSENDFGLGSRSYITFADYTNSAADAEKAGSDKDELLADETEVASPYVVTSPKSTLSVIDKEGEAARYLHGDGAAWTGTSTFVTTAEKIFNEKTSASTGLFAYKKTGVTDFNFAGNLSTYNSNQTQKIAEDFPVLQITAGDKDIDCISNYLDILTNGGYSKALACTTGSIKPVTVKAETYVYDSNSSAFVKSDAKPALNVTGLGTNNITYSVSTDYDNDKDRFTLLTVTFCSDPSSDPKHKYELQIPIIVRRVLEVDFVATLGYGTHFRSADYDQFTGHVLDSFGNSMTGYLTYVYNSAKGKATPYGWKEYIAAGGDLTQTMDKKVIFTSELPTGTQLTLVDCQDPDRTAYYYTVTGTKDNRIPFSSFKKSDGSTAFASESIGECMGVSVTEDAEGIFIEVDQDGKPTGDGESSESYSNPTVVKNGRYYRIATDAEKNRTHYSVAIDESATTENYYLVVTMPKTDEMTYVNGYVLTELDTGISHNINYMERDMKTVDIHSNTASTYLISDGYQQVLDETLGASSTLKVLNASDSSIRVSVRDTITYPNDQAYNTDDQLYQRFSGSLQTSVKGDDGTDTIRYESFPSGTTGKARFYVYTIKDGVYTYYAYNTETGKWSDGQSDKQTAVEYTWISTGGNMDLPLSTDGTAEHAISLQQLRDKIKTSSERGTTTTFYIEAVMDAAIPSSGLSVIPVSTTVNGVPQSYAKMNYVAQLSTEKASLSYSSNKASLTDTRIRYYQEDMQGMELIYDADDINQLGINLLDLQNNLDKDEKNAIIGTTARLDMSAMQNLESVLRNSKGIRFRLTLSQKDQTAAEDYSQALNDAESYMSMKLQSPDSGDVVYENGTWTWTIPASTYYEDGRLKTGVIFDGSVFTQAVDLLVNVENVESAGHLYSNYKVELTAEIVGADGTVETAASDNLIYTLTKIKPEFSDRD